MLNRTNFVKNGLYNPSFTPNMLDKPLNQRRNVSRGGDCVVVVAVTYVAVYGLLIRYYFNVQAYFILFFMGFYQRSSGEIWVGMAGPLKRYDPQIFIDRLPDLKDLSCIVGPLSL